MTDRSDAPPRHVCRVCLVALNWHDEVGWIHPLGFAGTDDHVPDAIPIEAAHDTRLRCDVCFAPDPHWTVPATSFEVPELGVGSTENWSVCGKCARIIDDGDRHKLVYRFLRTSPNALAMNSREREQISPHIHAWFRLLFEHKTGPCFRHEVPAS